MYVWYGYQLPNSDTIEWIRGAKLQCSAWESDDYSATIRCQDLFRNMDEEYYKGCYAPAGITYYHAAELVFQDAGIDEYYIDPYLILIHLFAVIESSEYNSVRQRRAEH